MASGDANELEKEVKSTGNDESDRIDEVDTSEDRESRQSTTDVSAKKEVSLADILENPDKFPNMINIMIAMNKFPIDGGSVAKFLGNKFKQPVTPDTADKLLASVLVDMFRKISNDLNGIVLFENGEIDDAKSIQQAMEQGIPVPPGVNKETFEDKYKTALDIIRKDAEIFSVDRFVGNFLEKSMEKNAEYVHLDEVISPYLFNPLIGQYLAYSRPYYNNSNISKEEKAKIMMAEFKEAEQKLEEDFHEDKLMDIVRLRHGDEYKTKDQTSPDEFKERLDRVSRMRNLSLAKFGVLEQTGNIPGKTIEEQIDNATMMILVFDLYSTKETSASKMMKKNDEYKDKIELIVAKLRELTNGEIKFGTDRKQYLADIARYKAQKNGEISDPNVELTEEQVNASVLQSMRNIADNTPYKFGVQLHLALEAMKKGSLDPRLITQRQNQLLKQCPEIAQQVEGIYQIGGRGYSQEGEEIIKNIRDDILRTSLDRELTAIENALNDKDAVITPDQKDFYGKVLLLKLYRERERARTGVGTAINANSVSNMGNEFERIGKLLTALYPEVANELGNYRPSKPPVMPFARAILHDDSITNSSQIHYDKIIAQMENAYMDLYCYDTLLPNVELLLEQSDKISDKAFEAMWNKSRDEINLGSRAYEIDRLARYTNDSRVDFQGQTGLFENVYKTQYVYSWVTPENVVHLRYLELKLKHAQLKNNGAKSSELKEVEEQMRQMELKEGDELKKAFGSDEYKDVSFDGYLHTIDGYLDGHVDAIQAAAKGDKSDVGAVMFGEVVTFNRMKLESRVCQYFYANVFRDKAENHFTLTLEEELQDHMEYCIYALNIAKNYESEANCVKGDSQKQQEFMAKKELFEKMAHRGLELISKGRKKPYIEFDENGKATINEDNIARRYCKATGKKYTNTQDILDGMYKDGMTLYPARKLDEYYADQSQLKSFGKYENSDPITIFDNVIFHQISEVPTGKPDPKILSTFQLSKLNYDKVISCYRDRGLASTLAICAQKTLASWNLANKNSFGRQLFSKIIKKALRRYDANQTLPEGQADVRDGHNSEDVKMNETEQRNAQENEKQDFVQHVPTPTVPSGSDRDISGDPQQSAGQKESDGQEIV